MKIKTLTLLTATALLVGAVAVSAQPGQASDRASDRPGPGAGFAKACEEGRIDSDRCERAREIGDKANQARRAAHHAHQAADAIQEAVFRLELKEYRARAALDDPEITEEQAANLTAKIDRIQAAQDKLLERAHDLRERVDDLKERWSEVKDHIESREKVEWCHVPPGDPENATTLMLPPAAAHAHARAHEDDHRGACDDGTETETGTQTETETETETETQTETETSTASETQTSTETQSPE